MTRFLPRRTRSLTILIVLLAAVGAVSAPSASAVGTYSVALSGTSAPGWSVAGSGGHFTTPSGAVLTSSGAFAAWSSRRWRLSMPAGVTIASGTIHTATSTPHAAFSELIIEGSGSATPRTIASHAGSSSFTDTLWSGADRIDVALVATADVSLTTSGTDSLHVGATNLVLADPSTPVVATDVVEPFAWHGPGRCAPMSIAASDTGSGVVDLTVHNISNGSGIARWTSRTASVMPGLARATHSICIPSASLQHGTNVVAATVTDGGGRVAEQRVQIRADTHAPTFSGLPDDGAVLTTAMPAFTFTASDADSGAASTSADVDGTPLAITIAAGELRAQPRARLALGHHVLNVVSVDAVGNAARATVGFDVTDVTPPSVTISAPTGRVGTSPWLQARADDADGDLDVSSWTVDVDGNRVAATPYGAVISGPLGTLTPGDHVVTIQVADTTGNVASVGRAFTVSGSVSDAAAASIGARTGLFAITSTHITAQEHARVQIASLAAQSGRPLALYRVLFAGAGITQRATVTDAMGIARIEIRADRPGSFQASVDGLAARSLTYRVEVQPRLRLHAKRHTARVGTPIALAGRMSRAHAGERLMIEAHIASSWYPIGRTVTVRRDGTFRFSVRASLHRTVAVRVVARAHSGWVAGRSNAAVIRVS